MLDAETSDPTAALYCDRCGDLLAGGDHAECLRARDLEPPRFCPRCRRRMVVQVTPNAWTARCSEHGAQAGGERTQT